QTPARAMIYMLSLHDALPIYMDMGTLNIGMLKNDIGLVAIPHALHILLRHFHELPIADPIRRIRVQRYVAHWLFCSDICGQIRRSEEHTSELQSRENLVCRLL